MNKASKQISVLVVEDEQSLNDAFVYILKSADITVETSFNGLEALEKLKTLKPDVIILDLKMPKMDGIEFLTAYNQLEPKRTSKIIVFSNYNEQAEIDKAFFLGASKYMLKAWASPAELVKVVTLTAQAAD